ncbi:dipeptidase [Sinanaerobacter sp. ZZT-01]|uniref:dipeptidase n=1 Tax=Sinanaerobacter sp. ZZT-01 TaxID=3111540 RepID=UPI002D76C252|nr:membrane dipeptidase [Sinanaerobacter sp. ZZT-01]WRR92241.1 membrane dipeptidase [Sinanaerobacter sp. ZZT-01]
MVFDGHSDIWSDVTIRSLRGETDILRKYHLPRLREGQIEGSIFVIWVDPPYDKEPYKRTLQIIDAVKKEIAVCDEIVIVKNYEQMMKAKGEGKFYIFIGLEGLSSVGENLRLIDEYYDFGARHAMLSWNEQNALATGVQGDPSRGLTSLGKQAVKKIMDKNMIMDVSHLNEKSFWDVVSMAQAPIIASHSNARALSNAERNLTDEQLLEIRNLDGLVGINSFNRFVSLDLSEQTVDNLLKHIVYICNKIGVEHVGFGFDFFEFMSVDSMRSYSDQDTSYTAGLEDCSKVPALLEKMRKTGFSDEEIDAISYKNFHRIIKKIIG